MIKKSISILLVIAIFFSMNINSFASDVVVDKIVTLQLGTFSNTAIYIENMKSSIDIRNISVSNDSICSAYWNKESFDNIIVYPKKAGECYVSGDIYDGEILIKHFSTKIILYKHTNPFKKMKIGKKNYIKKFNKNTEFTLKMKKGKKIRVNVKIKKNFSKLKMYYCWGSDYKKIKNNKYFKTKKKKNQYISIELYDKKVKLKREYSINFK